MKEKQKFQIDQITLSLDTIIFIYTFQSSSTTQCKMVIRPCIYDAMKKTRNSAEFVEIIFRRGEALDRKFVWEPI